MPRRTNLVSAMERFGLKVTYVKGWSTRGSTYFDPKGVLDHWTAGPRYSKSRPSLSVVTNGRKGLPGPLCNIYLARDGSVVVVSAGRANHGGPGYWKGWRGNTHFFGIEAEAADNADWTAAQRVTYPIVNAALLWIIGQKDASYVAGHSEYALPRGRKIDINGYTMTTMRRQTQAMINGGPKAAKARIKSGGAPAKVPSKPKPKPAPSKPKNGNVQSINNKPNGSTTFPDSYEDLALDGSWKQMSVGAFQILMHAIAKKAKTTHNKQWDGDWGKLSIKDAQTWLKWVGFYRKTNRGLTLVIDGDDGFWFWYELQRFLRSKGFYNRTSKGAALKLDGKPAYWTIYGFQQYMNGQN